MNGAETSMERDVPAGLMTGGRVLGVLLDHAQVGVQADAHCRVERYLRGSKDGKIERPHLQPDGDAHCGVGAASAHLQMLMCAGWEQDSRSPISPFDVSLKESRRQ